MFLFLSLLSFRVLCGASKLAKRCPPSLPTSDSFFFLHLHSCVGLTVQWFSYTLSSQAHAWCPIVMQGTSRAPCVGFYPLLGFCKGEKTFFFFSQASIHKHELQSQEYGNLVVTKSTLSKRRSRVWLTFLIPIREDTAKG